MKKLNLLKTLSIGFLSCFLIATYTTKLKSIVISVDFSAYLIFLASIVLCGILLYSKEELKSWVEMVSGKDKSIEEFPDKIYTFCKTYYFKEEADLAQFVKQEVKNINLNKFFVRYLDKNTQAEIEEYLVSQRIEMIKKETSAKKVTQLNSILLIVGVGASYIYDSSIKGILLMGGIGLIANLIVSKNIEKNILNYNLQLELFKHISKDILSHKSAKMIMYKTRSMLTLEEDELTVDDFIRSDVPVTDASAESSQAMTDMQTALKNNTSFENRKSALVTISKKSNSLIENRKKKNSIGQ